MKTKTVQKVGRILAALIICIGNFAVICFIMAAAAFFFFRDEPIDRQNEIFNHLVLVAVFIAYYLGLFRRTVKNARQNQ